MLRYIPVMLINTPEMQIKYNAVEGLPSSCMKSATSDDRSGEYTSTTTFCNITDCNASHLQAECAPIGQRKRLHMLPYPHL